MFEIGNTLREARVRNKLTLQQAEEDTKIRIKYLQAMENEEFELMPGATYVKGFLRTYSNYLGLDPDVMVEEYHSRGVQHREQQEPFGGVSIAGPRRRRGRNIFVIVAVVCVVALAAIYLLGVLRGGDNKGPTTQPSVLGLSSPSPSPKQPSAKAKPKARPTRTDVRAVADTWVQVRRTGPKGPVLYSGTLKRGQSKRFVDKVLWLRFGSPTSIRLRFEGKPLPSLPGPGPSDYLLQNGKLTKRS